MLQSERVTLRGLKRDDLARIWLFNNDLEVELAGGGDPPMPQSMERLIAEFDRGAAAGGRDGAWFAIEVDDAIIGQCGLMHPNETALTCELRNRDPGGLTSVVGDSELNKSCSAGGPWSSPHRTKPLISAGRASALAFAPCRH